MKGGHREAEICQQGMDELAARLASLSDNNTTLRTELDAELARQRQIDSLLKDAALQETRLNTYLNAVQTHIDMGTFKIEQMKFSN